ncbi:MAG: tetratricopeptide repeat protein [Planctomycetota bacterium]
MNRSPSDNPTQNRRTIGANALEPLGSSRRLRLGSHFGRFGSAALWPASWTLALVTCWLGMPCHRVVLARQSAPETGGADSALVEELVLEGDYEEAEELLAESALDERLSLWKARLFRETGRGREALEFLIARPEYGGGSPDVLAAVGGLRTEIGDNAAAEKDLRAALAARADHLEARVRLGLLLMGAGRGDEGKGHLKRIIDFYQGLTTEQARALSPESYVWMGRACEGLNRHRDAYKVMYESALDLDPGCAIAHVESGRILLAKYNYPDARSHFKDAIKCNDNLAEAHIGLAQSTIVDYGFPGNRFQAAIASLERADRIWRDHPETLLLRGWLAFYDEDWDAARGFYERAIAQNPSNLHAQAQLAAVYYCQPNLAAFEALVTRTEREHPAPARFFGSLAERLVDRFFYAQGVEYARKAIELDPDYWPAYVIRGINALRIGENEEGEYWSKRAFDADRFNVWANNTLVLVRHMQKTFTEKETDRFVFRMPQADAPFMLPYLEPLLDDTLARFEREYRVQVAKPVTVEAFSQHQYFSARSIGLPGLAASGVCFGKMVTLTTPRALPGNWGVVAVHEFMHVVSLGKTGHRVPRWFTEGLSVFEEGRHQQRWIRRYPEQFVEAVEHGLIVPMERIQGAFTKPQYPEQILLAYYQGGVICEYVEERYGFEKILEMLSAYRDGKNTEQVFRDVLGVSLAEFDGSFLAYAREQAAALGLTPRYLTAQVEPLRLHLDDHPDDADSWIKLGLAYVFTGKLADAEISVSKAQQLGSKNPDLHSLVGFLKFAQGKTSGAIEALERAIAEGGRYRYRNRVALAALLDQEKKPRERTMGLLREAIEIHPDGIEPRFGQPNPYYFLARLLTEEDREADAIAVLEQLVRVARDDLEVRKRLGAYYTAREEWPLLVQALGDAPFIDPFDGEVHQMLAKGYVEVEAYESALRELEVLLAFEDPALEKIYPELAFCHLKLGNRDQAADFAKRALGLAPTSERAKSVLDALESK